MDAARTRQVHLGALVAAVVLALLGLLLLNGPGDAGARLVVIVALLALVAVEVAMVVQARRATPTYAEEPLTSAPAEQRITIRCKHCGEVFPVDDTGVRPLVAACPHCGKSGTIKVRTDAHTQ